jgi:TolC family type I secretion outer membrane protein
MIACGRSRPSARKLAGAAAAAGALLSLFACAAFEDRPEWNPDAFAPPAHDRAWAPSPALAAATGAADRGSRARAQASEALAATPAPAGLADLIDLALRENPETRAAWAQAKARAAELGRAQSSYYPAISAADEAGYGRFLFQARPGPITIEQWSAEPQLELTWLLLDFGRRSSASDVARERLVAANYSFNRKMQDVVFAVQSAYYALDAARSLLTAAEENLRLAETVRAAAEQRLGVGLETQPDVLLARQAEARAMYERENARVAVSDAQADLALTLGAPADRPLEIAGLRSETVPAELVERVDELIDAALAERPDLAAKAAELRAREAEVELARASLWPTIGFEGQYGLDVWRYRFDGPPTDSVASPDYGAFLTFEWDLFLGFDRWNRIRQAQAERDRTLADLERLELEVIAAVWRAWHDFRAARQRDLYAAALLTASKDAYASTLESYRHGLSTIVDLLTGERDLAGARYTRIQSRAELLTSAAKLAYVSGALSLGAPPSPRPPAPLPAAPP